MTGRFIRSPQPTVTLSRTPRIVRFTFNQTIPQTRSLTGVLRRHVTNGHSARRPTRQARRRFLHRRQPVNFKRRTTVRGRTTNSVSPHLLITSRRFLDSTITMVINRRIRQLLSVRIHRRHLLRVNLLRRAMSIVRQFHQVTRTRRITNSRTVTLHRQLPRMVPVPANNKGAVGRRRQLALPNHPMASDLTARGRNLTIFTPSTRQSLNR